MRSWVRVGLSVVLAVVATSPSLAQSKYDTGASDGEIKIGTIGPFSGPASSLAAITKSLTAYFSMINEAGGINGRKVNMIAYDDGYSPPKTVEQARKLVESDEVLAVAAIVGSAGNSAIQKYMNQRRIPHLFVGSGAAKWADPRNFPWSMGWLPSYRDEAKIYARYILDNYPGKTVGVLYQNDDFGRDYIQGLQESFGPDMKKVVVAQIPFEVSAPTIDAQIVQLKASNPDIFLNVGTPKFAAQAIKKVAELNWSPVHIVTNVSVSVSAVLKPAGLENSKGLISAAYLKDSTDPQWKDDAGVTGFRTFMAKWVPEGDPADTLYVYGYAVAKTLERVLKQCGDDLTRANVMKQAANLDMSLEMTVPGIRIKTSPTDYSPIEQVQMMRFNGSTWVLFGQLLGKSGD